MTPSTQAISPLRQRMIDDMRMRKLSPKTQSHYLRAVRQFAGYLGRSPDTGTVEDLRRYQLHLVDHGMLLNILTLLPPVFPRGTLPTAEPNAPKTIRRACPQMSTTAWRLYVIRSISQCVQICGNT